MSQPLQTLSKRVVAAVLRDLCDRRGFDDWWDNIDPQIQREAKAELQAKVAKVLAAEQDRP